MPRFDFAIVGSTAFAGLLAGQLAHVQGKRVLRIARRPSPQRLPRRIDMALAVATRVQTWDLLERGAAETRTLISRIGAPDAIVPTGVRIKADTEASAAALAHIVHIAVGYGLRGRNDGTGWIFSAVPLLRPDRLEEKVAAWLAAAGVQTVDPDTLRMEFDGVSAARFRIGEETIEAEQVVLADDGAILDLPEEQRPAGLSVEPITATVLGGMRSIGSPVHVFLDRGVRLQQRVDGSILGLIGGDAELEGRLASTLTGPFPVQRLATGRARRIATADGAPSFARLDTSNVRIVAGLGDAAAFFAVTLARCLAAASDAAEHAWFAAHEPVVGREAVAEFAA